MDSRKRLHHFKGLKSTALPPYHSQFHWNNLDSKSRYSCFKSPRLQRQSYKRKNEVTNIESLIPCKKSLTNASKKSIPLPEETEEEERKKKLSDTANKLLSKIKTWSAENNFSVDKTKSDSDSKELASNLSTVNKLNELEQSENVNSVTIPEAGESISVCSKDSSRENRHKRIAHNITKSKASGVKKFSSKKKINLTRITNPSMKYEVNKETVKNFQNRIQQKLINELMQMPKENLQNVLNDPKINPMMQVKISHLVKKNKLLIAQKLRSLAESKMSSKEGSTNPQFLIDIDNLIYPVVETDLSVLPYELIKEMENIFQVQFDYSNSKNNAGAESLGLDCGLSDSTKNCSDNGSSNLIEEEISKSESECTVTSVSNFSTITKNSNEENNFQFDEDLNDSELNEKTSPIKFEHTSNSNEQALKINSKNDSKESNITFVKTSNEDLTAYECSTDEDEENDKVASLILPSDHKSCEIIDSGKKAECLSQRNAFATQSIKNKFFYDEKIEKSSIENNDEGEFGNSNNSLVFHNDLVEKESLSLMNFPNSNKGAMHSRNVSVNRCSSDEFGEFKFCSYPSNTFQFNSTSCQTEYSSKSASTQTCTLSNESSILCGISMPEESEDESPTSLLQEVNSIQNLINKLSERRFMIFLKLARINPEGDFTKDSSNHLSFIESVTSGNIYLADLLKQFLGKTQKNGRGGMRTRNCRGKKK